MTAVLAAASYSRIGFSPCLAMHARRVRFPGGSASRLEPGIIMSAIYEVNNFLSRKLWIMMKRSVMIAKR